MTSKGELLRQRIVAAADELFYQQGYENTSFNDIASAVEISRGNFYFHFKSKDEILNAVIDKRLQDIKCMLETWEQNSRNPKDNLIAYIDMLDSNQSNIKNHGCPIGVICTELNKTNHFMLSDAIEMHTLFKDWLTQQFKQLGQKKQAEALAMHLLARSQGIANITHTFGNRKFLKQEIKLLKEWLEDAIQ